MIPAPCTASSSWSSSQLAFVMVMILQEHTIALRKPPPNRDDPQADAVTEPFAMAVNVACSFFTAWPALFSSSLGFSAESDDRNQLEPLHLFSLCAGGFFLDSFPSIQLQHVLYCPHGRPQRHPIQAAKFVPEPKIMYC